MSLVYLAGTNPWLPLFIGFDEGDSGESAGEVTEQLDLHSRVAETEQKQNLKDNLNQIHPLLCLLISLSKHSQNMT